jgi:uncharacterized protein YcaQ
MSPARPAGIDRLRTLAVGASLIPASSLDRAVQALRFVQYDPIRRPARAQDLILHQRVRGYRSGDLGRAYAGLELEEEHLHGYGAMTRDLAELLHPRPDRDRPGCRYLPRGLAAAVLDVVREHGPIHPRALAVHFGPARTVNDWGGVSAATTRALEELHYYGFVRVVHRERGVRVYAARVPQRPALEPRERLRRITLQLARNLAPISAAGLRATLGQLQQNAGIAVGRKAIVAELLVSRELEAEVVDGVRYLWPAGLAESTQDRVPRRLRFLAPFDPVVWDRGRFEHLWGWPYRFTVRRARQLAGEDPAGLRDHGPVRGRPVQPGPRPPRAAHRGWLIVTLAA